MRYVHFLKRLRLILTFYSNFFFASLLINAGCLLAFYRYGLETFTAIFWVKAIAMAVIFYYVKNYKEKEFYYYQNLGVSKTMLWAASLSADFILFILLIITTYRIR